MYSRGERGDTEKKIKMKGEVTILSSLTSVVRNGPAMRAERLGTEIKINIRKMKERYYFIIQVDVYMYMYV